MATVNEKHLIIPLAVTFAMIVYYLIASDSEPPPERFGKPTLSVSAHLSSVTPTPR